MSTKISQPDADALPASKEAEAVDALRKALVAIGRHVGAFLSDDVSTEFLLLVPEEVRLVMERHRRAALSNAIPAGDGVPNKWEPRAWEKLQLWFFRDMSDEQRLKLFSLFGLPADEIGKSHGHQSIALKHVRAMLSTASTAGDRK